nr:MAG TPA: hypothetical protein [Caudoviricetes sp.]
MAGEHAPCEDCRGCVTPHQSHFVADVGGAVKPGQCVEQVVIPGDFLRWSAGESALLWSLAVGVGKNEKPLPVVRDSHIGCSYTCPPCIPPDAGKVFQNLGESQCEVAAYVLEECDSWSKMLNCLVDIGPEMPFIVGSFTVPSLRKGLARIASSENVNARHAPPIHFGYVAKVGNLRVVMRKDAGWGLVDFSEPRGLRVQDLGHTHF